MTKDVGHPVGASAVAESERRANTRASCVASQPRSKPTLPGSGQTSDPGRHGPLPGRAAASRWGRRWRRRWVQRSARSRCQAIARRCVRCRSEPLPMSPSSRRSPSTGTAGSASRASGSRSGSRCLPRTRRAAGERCLAQRRLGHHRRRRRHPAPHGLVAQALRGRAGAKSSASVFRANSPMKSPRPSSFAAQVWEATLGAGHEFEIALRARGNGRPQDRERPSRGGRAWRIHDRSGLGLGRMMKEDRRLRRPGAGRTPATAILKDFIAGLPGQMRNGVPAGGCNARAGVIARHRAAAGRADKSKMRQALRP